MIYWVFSVDDAFSNLERQITLNLIGNGEEYFNEVFIFHILRYNFCYIAFNSLKIEFGNKVHDYFFKLLRIITKSFSLIKH